MTDDYYDPKHCTPDRELKPRRPTPHMRASELFGDGRLMRTRDGRWIFKVPRCGGGGVTFSFCDGAASQEMDGSLPHP